MGRWDGRVVVCWRNTGRGNLGFGGRLLQEINTLTYKCGFPAAVPLRAWGMVWVGSWQLAASQSGLQSTSWRRPAGG